jgi:predicted transcriptional regulator
VTMRITRHARRVLDLLAKGPAPASEITNETNINLPTLWPLLDRLADEGMISVANRQWSITPQGREAREATETARNAPSDGLRAGPGPQTRAPRPRPPYTDRRTPWPRGEGRPR